MEPESTKPRGNKIKFLIIVLGMGFIIGSLLWRGAINYSNDTFAPPKNSIEASVEKPVLPRVLSSEEKQFVESRIQSPVTSSVTAQAKTATGQKIQNTELLAPLTKEEQASIEKRIISQ